MMRRVLANLFTTSVTLLAFIFVPLSLSTSIFGMNVQELNSTGQPIWVFLVTATAILMAAFWIWAIFYQVIKYIHAPKTTRFIYPIVAKRVRLRYLLWLICNGKIIWCWRSGIVYSLLTNGRLGFTVTCGGEGKGQDCRCPPFVNSGAVENTNRSGVLLSTHSAHAPCTYIYAHQRHPSERAFSFDRGV